MSLRHGVLGLLVDGPLHGYELKLRFEDLVGQTRELNVGQVYETLQRLERDGLIAPTGERGSRGRQKYVITDRGREVLRGWLDAPDDEPQLLREDFHIKLLVAMRVANGHLDSIVAGQKRAQLQRLSDLGRLERDAEREGRTDLALLLQGAALHAQADLEWLEICADTIKNTTPARGGNGRNH